MFDAMIDDPEIKALNECCVALNGLGPEAIERALDWLGNKFMIKPSNKAAPASDKHAATPGPENAKTDSAPVGKLVEIEKYETTAELLSALNVTENKERVLGVAAYLQKANPEDELSGFKINKELKHIGHGILNITSAIQQCVNSTPQLMIQLRKGGTTRQAKKNYKVTDEGFKWVTARLAKK